MVLIIMSLFFSTNELSEMTSDDPYYLVFISWNENIQSWLSWHGLLFYCRGLLSFTNIFLERQSRDMIFLKIEFCLLSFFINLAKVPHLCLELHTCPMIIAGRIYKTLNHNVFKLILLNHTGSDVFNVPFFLFIIVM